MIIPITYRDGGYDIVIEENADFGAELNLDRKVLVVTDDGVPEEYAARLAAVCKEPTVLTVPQGEGSKSFPTLEKLLQTMLDKSFSRSDCVCAVGGGVVGDLSGFAASIYMRGIDFYNVPTTLLSQVDSSIGGKTAIDFGGIKNVVGSFYRPQKVVIDPTFLDTLDDRQFAAGMAEVVKMAATCDRALFEFIEKNDVREHVGEIITRALRVKKAVVEADEREGGLRRVLNFGHTLGHGVESLGGRLHGECVALGMIPMCAPQVRARLLPALRSLGLPTGARFDREAAFGALVHDKKADKDGVCAVFVPEIGRYEFRELSFDALRAALDALPER